MIYDLAAPVSSGALAQALGLEYRGGDIAVAQIATLARLAPGRLGFSVAPLDSIPAGSVVIAPALRDAAPGWLPSRRPRLDFIRALHWLQERRLLPERQDGHVHPEAQVHPTAVVEAGAAIGPGCKVGPYAYIRAPVVLRCRVRVGASTAMGHDGFGYERDGRGCPLHFPHLGLVVIDDDVDVGALCSFARGALEDTVIGPGVKIDDQAYIAHGVSIGANTMVMSGVRLNGRARVGAGCWIGTGALVRESCSVGDGGTEIGRAHV
jgi:UDP-3-O-[3-hydroxymyristoyl] glucosamine N-acyltransferase